jgi:acetolactate synthase-1/2/3 large subunit
MKASELFVKCLENEGVKTIYGVPGEENLDVMDALLDSAIEFVTCRHEQAAAFMADVHGRLTGRAGVCLSTLGPGATNLITGVADAQLDSAPLVALAGQASTHRLHKESHQVLRLVELFKPISKYSVEILEAENIPEIIRKAFKVAQMARPGVSFVELPENIAEKNVEGKFPLKVQSPHVPVPPLQKIEQAAKIISQAKYPIILAGNDVIRADACDALVEFAETLNIPVANTFMAKGVLSSSHRLSLGTIGLQAHDHVNCGFDTADVVICAGYDLVEYAPVFWNPNRDKKIVHINLMPAEVDENYILEVGVVGDIGAGLKGIAQKAVPFDKDLSGNLRHAIMAELEAYQADTSFPLKPQKIVSDLREVLRPEDMVICDVGAHKMWMARMYQAEKPNTCIISNGFCSMGIALPGAIAAKRVFPERTVVAVTGDAGVMMNIQDLETAVRIKTPIIILIWTDRQYGLIQWKQMVKFRRTSHVDFSNPDFVKLAESFGAKGYQVMASEELVPILEQAILDQTVVLIDCPVDYRENAKLTESLGEVVCPL